MTNPICKKYPDVFQTAETITNAYLLMGLGERSPSGEAKEFDLSLFQNEETVRCFEDQIRTNERLYTYWRENVIDVVQHFQTTGNFTVGDYTTSVNLASAIAVLQAVGGAETPEIKSGPTVKKQDSLSVVEEGTPFKRGIVVLSDEVDLRNLNILENFIFEAMQREGFPVVQPNLDDEMATMENDCSNTKESICVAETFLNEIAGSLGKKTAFYATIKKISLNEYILELKFLDAVNDTVLKSATLTIPVSALPVANEAKKHAEALVHTMAEQFRHPTTPQQAMIQQKMTALAVVNPHFRKVADILQKRLEGLSMEEALQRLVYMTVEDIHYEVVYSALLLLQEMYQSVDRSILVPPTHYYSLFQPIRSVASDVHYGGRRTPAELKTLQQRVLHPLHWEDAPEDLDDLASDLLDEMLGKNPFKPVLYLSPIPIIGDFADLAIFLSTFEKNSDDENAFLGIAFGAGFFTDIANLIQLGIALGDDDSNPWPAFLINLLVGAVFRTGPSIAAFYERKYGNPSPLAEETETILKESPSIIPSITAMGSGEGMQIGLQWQF